MNKKNKLFFFCCAMSLLMGCKATELYPSPAYEGFNPYDEVTSGYNRDFQRPKSESKGAQSDHSGFSKR